MRGWAVVLVDIDAVRETWGWGPFDREFEARSFAQENLRPRSYMQPKVVNLDQYPDLELVEAEPETC